MPEPITNRYDFVLLFDVADGNPNGDPDAGNLPRLDPETGEGIVTDVCLKRKVRNYVELAKDGKPPHAMYVKEKAVLNRQHEAAYAALDLDPEDPTPDSIEKVRRYLCTNFYDVRTFGAVMSTGDKIKKGSVSVVKANAGQVRGPVQLTFGRSIGPIVSLEHSITRMAVTNERDLEKERTMGRKSTVPYGLYRTHGFVSAAQARDTGFSEADLTLFWSALTEMFEHDRSAARGMMSTRGLYVFKHGSELGSAPAHQLFDRVKVARRNGAPRRFDDFQITIEEADLPEGVTLNRVVG